MKCATKYCRNKRVHHRTVCWNCKRRLYKERHPERYAYENLRNNARRRGKEFLISYDEFLQFSIETNYMLGKGKNKFSYHIDRIDENKGYTLNNIQILTNVENHKKYVSYSYNEQGTPSNYKTQNQLQINKEEYPF